MFDSKISHWWKVFTLACTFLAIQPCLAQSSTWKPDNLIKIGGHKVEVLGKPKVIRTDKGWMILWSRAKPTA